MFVLSVFVLPLAVEITFFRQRQSCFHRLRRSELGRVVNDALFNLRNFENGELVQKNAEFMEYLQLRIFSVLFGVP